VTGHDDGGGAVTTPGADPAFGDTWVYESLVGGIPGLRLTTSRAIGLQFVLFEALVLGLAAVYGLSRSAVAAGTVAVVVAAAGSVAMLYIGGATRAAGLPDTHRRLLFGSSVEVLLSVLSFVGVVTYVLVGGAASVVATVGGRPPAPVVAVALLLCWDLCYRGSTAWWTALVSLRRSLRHRVTPETARRCRRIDAATVAFGLLELALVPVVAGDALLVGVVVGHAVAVTVVSTAAALLLETDRDAGRSLL
jgi:hypothetical protein